MAEIDLSFLASKLEADIKNTIIQEVREVCIKALREAINSTVYSWTPSAYERTMGFINAVDIMDFKISGTSATFNLTVNPGKIAPFIKPQFGAPKNPNAKWGSHVNFNGQQVTTSLIKMLDQGGGSSYYRHPAWNFFNKSSQKLENEIPNIMRSALSARGWEVY